MMMSFLPSNPAVGQAPFIGWFELILAVMTIPCFIINIMLISAGASPHYEDNGGALLVATGSVGALSFAAPAIVMAVIIYVFGTPGHF